MTKLAIIRNLLIALFLVTSMAEPAHAEEACRDYRACSGSTCVTCSFCYWEEENCETYACSTGSAGIECF